MKIICIAHNYLDRIKELGKEIPENPIFFFKPDTALLRNNEDFYIPEFSNEIHYEVELVVKIDRVVKAISKKFASRCYTTIGIGIDFTARDLQLNCIENGEPWEISKAFDKSAPISKNFIELNALECEINNLNIRLDINGKCVQKANTNEMIFDIETIIEHVSKYTTLKIGDLIFSGAPSGVGKVNIGDRLEAYVENHKLLDFYIR